MSWFKGLVKTVAPIAASVFGGPIAGAAVGALTSRMGNNNAAAAAGGENYADGGFDWSGALTSGINALGQAGPAIGSAFGAYQQNQAQIGQAQATNQFNADQANQNRVFQEHMFERQMEAGRANANAQMAFQHQETSTAYQRATEDLKAAGLNPMLAYSQGGASSGSGAMASPSAPSGGQASGTMAQIANEIAPAIGTAFTAQKMNAELKQMEAQTQFIETNTRKSEAEIPAIGAGIGQTLKATEKMDYEITKMVAETSNTQSRTALQNVQRAVEEVRVKVLKGELDIQKADLLLKKYQAEISRLAATGSGAVVPYLEKGRDSISSAVDALGGFLGKRAHEAAYGR